MNNKLKIIKQNIIYTYNLLIKGNKARRVVKLQRIFPFSTTINCLSDITDLALYRRRHHRNITWIAVNVAKEMGLSDSTTRDLAVAGSLHDIGMAFVNDAKYLSPDRGEDLFSHAEIGYQLLKDIGPLGNAASIIRYHHHDYSDMTKLYNDNIHFGGNILHLAEYVDNINFTDVPYKGYKDNINAKIKKLPQGRFIKEAVEAVYSLADKADFWEDLREGRNITDVISFEDVKLEEMDFDSFMKTLGRIIDYRSTYTVTHSNSVAVTAEALSKFYGFNDEDSHTLKIAGYIHDLGKLSIPKNILDKRGTLSSAEMVIVRQHTKIADNILKPFTELSFMRESSVLHHERLDGSGYPYGLFGNEIPVGSRIMAVADVYVALTEERPYRKKISPSEIEKSMERLAYDTSLDLDVVGTLLSYSSFINSIKQISEEKSRNEYKVFLEDIKQVSGGQTGFIKAADRLV